MAAAFHLGQDAGTQFEKDPEVRIQADPRNPAWKRLCPHVIALPESGARLFFMARGPFCPPGNIGVIVSAWSADLETWCWEEGVRVGAENPRAATRALAPDIVQLDDGTWRMYFEARARGWPNVILSARSDDLLAWRIEPDVRVESERKLENHGTPSAVRLPGGGWRLYHHARTPDRYEIVSSISDDGVTFEREPGTRIAQTSPFEAAAAYAPHVLAVEGVGWRMYYSGWSAAPNSHGRILSATSSDGLVWTKHPSAVLQPSRPEDAAHCSEPHCTRLPDGRWRLFYEAVSAEGLCRIMSATATP